MITELKTNISDRRLVNKKTKYIYIAGILLILAGVISIISWFPYIIGDQLLYQVFLENYNGDLTQEQVKELFSFCGSIGLILSIFPILGGLLAFKRKFWTITLLCSIIGLFTVGGFFLSSILSFFGLILLILYKKNFHQIKDAHS